ncbi:MAG: family hydrolase, diadenosine tetraphosphate hydrolase [Actinomycetia bacterium]|nr:family hydrolase, diadenosine tetraphosphate hydrolase [Actinomycetes bacterium]
MSLERLWAGWRSAYVSNSDTKKNGGCVFCRLAEAEDREAALVLEVTDTTLTVMNLYPYGSGHLLVAPRRHVADYDVLDEREVAAFAVAQQRAVRAIKAAYQPDGLNLGANIGRAAGAGIPDHVHMHVLPRWNGDTNFMTTVAEVRVLPEDLQTGYKKLRAVWPS